jgi:hypothetical protein
MKARICKICAESGIFCEQCDYKIKQRIVSMTEVEISRFMYEAESKFKELEYVQIEYVADVGNDLVLILISSPTMLKPSFLASLTKFVSEKSGKMIKIVEKTADIKRLVSQILYPIRVLSINQIWSPDGSYEFSVKVNSQDFKKSSINQSSIERVLTELLQFETRIQPV